jgi:hypothetical protein
MEPQTRIVHWYDTEEHRIACGAPGQSNSTKYARGVTCRACLALVAEAGQTGTATNATPAAVSYVH